MHRFLKDSVNKTALNRIIFLLKQRKIQQSPIFISPTPTLSSLTNKTGVYWF